MSDVLHRLARRELAMAARAMRRSVGAFGILLCVGALVAAAIGCAMAAVWLAVQPLIGAPLAAVTVAVVLLMLAMALLLATRRRLRQPVKVEPAPDLDLAAIFRADKTRLMYAALAAGLAVGGRKP